MSAKAKLRAVPDAQPVPPAPSYDYEHQERQRIARKDWAAVHVRGDRNPVFDWWPTARSLWRA